MANGRYDYAYKGAVFTVTDQDYWYKGGRHRGFIIYNLDSADVEDLYLPEDYNGKPLSGDYRLNEYSYGRKRIQFKRVKRLHIPANLSRIQTYNDVFPNLEEIIIDKGNHTFTAFGTKLIENKELVFVFSDGQKKHCHIPAGIECIGSGAFHDTNCEFVTAEFKDIKISENAFDETSQMTKQKKPIIIENTYVEYFGDGEDVVIPDNITNINEKAFGTSGGWSKGIKKITMARMLTKNRLGTLPCSLKTLCLTKQPGKINFNILRMFECLESISFPDCDLYQIIDGVIFSKDKKTLLYCPPCYKKEYIVPEGTENITSFAFKNNKSLARVTIPEGVKYIGAGAFYGCEELKSVTLPDSLEQIAGATEFMPFGVFECCRKLSKVRLPSRLRIIGGFAFSNTAIEKIDIPEGVEIIGEYAFASYKNTTQYRHYYSSDVIRPSFVSCSLPSSLKIIGRGAIAGAKEVTAFEGTAKGLISAIEAKLPDRSEYDSSLLWGESTIIMRNPDKPGRTVYIPGSLKIIARGILEQAWNQDEFDTELYAECFDNTNLADEKKEIALNMLSYEDIDRELYITYLRRTALRLCDQLIESHREEALISLIKSVELNTNQLRKILDKASKEGLPTVSAYLLQAIKPADQKVKKMRL